MARSVNTYSDTVAYLHFEPNDIEDQDQCEWDWNYFKESLIARIQKHYPSMVEVEDAWIDNEGRVLTENDHAQVIISEYCGCVSLSLMSKADNHEYYGYDQCHVNMANAFVARTAENFCKRFSQFNRIGRFSNGEAIYERV